MSEPVVSSHQRWNRRQMAIVGLALFVVALLILNSAWLADDAYISLRVVDNLWNGYGLRWNAMERVQVYTHPLWLTVLAAAYGITREPYWTTLALSLACSLATLWILAFRIALSPGAALLGLALLAGSKSFIEYSTSGLENPLSHLLLATYLYTCWRSDSSGRSLARLALTAGFCVVNRLDLALLVGPSLAWAMWRAHHRAPAALVGAIPLLAWFAFAWIYYGSLLPNTAHAKLPVGVSFGELIPQGLYYLGDSVRADPVTLSAIACAVVLALVRRVDRAVVLGCVAHLVYVTAIGGDFMSGRFLSPALVVAVCVISRRTELVRFRSALAVASVVAVGTAFVPRSPWHVWRYPQTTDPLVTHGHGIIDERAVYAPYTGLRAVLGGARPADHPWAKGGRYWRGIPQVVAYEAVGLLGYHAGPGVHIVDPMGLTDPLLSRLPSGKPWRIGHFKRALPRGYEETLTRCLEHIFPERAVRPPKTTCDDARGRQNLIENPALAAQYDDLALLTQAPLFDRRRISALFKGRYRD